MNKCFQTLDALLTLKSCIACPTMVQDFFYCLLIFLFLKLLRQWHCMTVSLFYIFLFKYLKSEQQPHFPDVKWTYTALHRNSASL